MRKLSQYILLVLFALIAMAALTPSFWEVQIRQRTARAYANLAAVGSAIESYRVDYDKYPGCGGDSCWGWPIYPYDYYWYPPDTMTTPIAYTTYSTMFDPFREDIDTPSPSPRYKRIRYTYVDMQWGMAGTRTFESPYYPFLKSYYGSWYLTSVGPDGRVTQNLYHPQYPNMQILYDPTNGINSEGDIIIAQRKMPDLD